MSSLNTEDVEKALSLSMGAPVIKHNKSMDTFTLMNIFFKALGKMGSRNLLEKIKQGLPGAEILQTWTSKENAESHCGYECVEFRIRTNAG